MCEKGGQVRIVATHPLGLPIEIDTGNCGGDIGMDITEVEDICSVFGDVLNVALDMMLCLAAVLQALQETFYVYHWVDGFFLVFLHSMDPDVNVTIYFAGWILAQSGFLCFASLPLQLSIFCA